MREDVIKSNWESLKTKSRYHFNKWIEDNRCVQELGRFAGDWQEQIQGVINKSVPLTWASRRKMANPNRPPADIEAEENDLIRAGADPKITIYRGLIDFSECPVCQTMTDFFQLKNPQAKLHTQFTGEMLNLHIDKLYDLDDDPNNVIRIMVMMQDWEPGQFLMYGNQIHQRWRSGDIHTFDWQNLPHATANASLTPRPMLVITGVKSEGTKKILEQTIDYKIC